MHHVQGHNTIIALLVTSDAMRHTMPKQQEAGESMKRGHQAGPGPHAQGMIWPEGGHIMYLRL